VSPAHPRRSGDPRRPASTTGGPPQPFPDAPELATAAAKALVSAKAMALTRKYRGDAGEMVQILWKRTNEFVTRHKGFSFESALDQVGREVETDLIYGRL